MKSRNEKGNVFFYILIAVALFAALSYALSKGGRNSSSALTSEQARIAAQEIIDYGNDVVNAVQKLRLRGCSDEEISFYNSSVSVLSDYQNTPEVRDECKIFNKSGGGLIYRSPESSWLEQGVINSRYGEWAFTGKTHITGVGTDLGTADSAELIFLLPFIHSDICKKINVKLGIGNQIPMDTFHWTIHFKDGNYGTGATVTEPSLINKTVACQTNNIFWQVLIAR